MLRGGWNYRIYLVLSLEIFGAGLSPLGFFGYVFWGIGPRGTSTPVVAAVLIAPKDAESPGRWNWSYRNDRCVGSFSFHLRPSRINFTLPGQPSSALRH